LLAFGILDHIFHGLYWPTRVQCLLAKSR
jgi:hypothetical protein